MPKIPYRSEKNGEDDEDYEIVSFEDFCDKSPNSKTDLLTLNDNINYRLRYEKEKCLTLDGGDCSRDSEDHKETSLCDSKAATWKRSSSFSPFGKFNPNDRRGSLFGGVIPKQNSDGEFQREHRYQRFSTRVTFCERIIDFFHRFGSTMLLIAVIVGLSIGMWYAVCGAVGTDGGEHHYRKLWEKTHQHELTTEISMKVLQDYHAMSNFSTSDKHNLTLNKKKFDTMKSTPYIERPKSTLKSVCAKVTLDKRFDCYPQDGASEENCVNRGCCWNATGATDGVDATVGTPSCFYPPDYDTYHFLNMTENRHGITVYYRRMRPSGYPGDFNLARMDFKYLSNDVLQIKIYDAENRRFEPPYPEIPMSMGSINNLQYRVNIESATTGFKVTRNDDNVTILDTQNVGSMILSDKFLQISSLLPTDKLYGIGERRGPLKLDMNWRMHTIFNFDTVPAENTNLYGSQPFYLALEESGKSHGVLMLNTNAMDIILQPTPAITYRTIGGVLHLLVMLGPAPAAVAAQHAAAVGRTFMPPYWALGFHLCKFNYGSLNVTQQVWQSNRDAGIPFDVQWNDLDYMNNSNDFTYDRRQFAGLPEFVRRVHDAGMHYVVLLDPGVSAAEPAGAYPPYDRGLELDVFIKNSSGQPFVGKVWNKVSTVFPDFTHPSAAGYWLEMMTSLHREVPFDGAWIDMNEPSNMVDGPLHGACAPEALPYRPHVAGARLRTKTLCMDARHHAGAHYDWHSLHAITEGIATNFALTEIRGKRPFVISRATSPGSGRYAGHWSGDVLSDWRDLRASIPEMLSFSLFGVAMMGADICGFRGDASPELCLRWTQLGAFYPFSRNHNSDTSIPQDPVSMGREVTAAARAALRLRYALLPYYYTRFWRAHVRGDTVATPLFFEFVSDPLTHSIDTQFLIGPDVMVAPILEPNVTATAAYLPGAAPWLALAAGAVWPPGPARLDESNTVLLRAGAVVALQSPPARGAVTTAAARAGPLQLLALWSAAAGARGGELYWDDGDSLNSYEEKKYSHIEFTLGATSLNGTVRWWGHGVPPVNNVTVHGVGAPRAVTLDGRPCREPACRYAHDAKRQVLRVYGLTLSLEKPFSLVWKYKHATPKITPKDNAFLDWHSV